jgi:hypothetical protein
MITTILNLFLIAAVVIVVIVLTLVGMLWWLFKDERY